MARGNYPARWNPIVFIFKQSATPAISLSNIINGTERLLVDNIRQEGDSLFIGMPFFDSRFALRIVDQKKLEGSYIKNYGNRIVVTRSKLFLIFLKDFRFIKLRLLILQADGRFILKAQMDSTEAVGEFKQSGSRVSGTFLTITGDYRFLEGVVSGDTLKLSAFDGGHAILL